jgi:ribonuclease HI
MPVIECDVDAAADQLDAAGVSIDAGNTDHERWRAKRNGAVAVAYDGKVVIQGRDPHRLTALLEADAEGEGGTRGRAHCYFDGAARGNPGPAAIGWAIATDAGIVVEGGERIDDTTNNRAEYEALLKVLDVAGEYGYNAVDVRGDSELVVKQVHGAYRTNHPELRERRVSVHERLDRFDDWTLEHVPREVNRRADENANEALDSA